MRNMKKFFIPVVLLFCSITAQAVVIEGEVSPGTYTRLKVDSSGRIVSSTLSGQSSLTQTNPVVTTTSAQVLAANTSRAFLAIQNNDPSGIIYVNFGSAATVAGSLKILPGGILFVDTMVSTQAINIIGSIASNANVVVLEGQ